MDFDQNGARLEACRRPEIDIGRPRQLIRRDLNLPSASEVAPREKRFAHRSIRRQFLHPLPYRRTWTRRRRARANAAGHLRHAGIDGHWFSSAATGGERECETGDPRKSPTTLRSPRRGTTLRSPRRGTRDDSTRAPAEFTMKSAADDLDHASP